MLASTSVTAQETNCAQIQNARERLACYDRQFPRQAPGTTTAPAATPAPKPAPKLAEEPLPSTAPSTTPPAPQPEVATPAAPAAAPAATLAPASEEPEKGGLFDWYEQADFTATIAGVRREDKQKMVFRLDNGQIWLQTSPRDLPIRKGDVVQIQTGSVGGFLLRTESGVTTRVRRIK